MFKNLLCSVKVQDGLTDSFSTQIGVKQGCILSPYLFSLYINDLVSTFDASCDPVQLDDTSLSCLLYADDIVLLSNSAAGLQTLLNKLGTFCHKWNLKVNINKTKVIVFNKSGKVLKGFTFRYEGNHVELANEYKYLGIIFKPSESYTYAIKYLCKKALKAIFCVRKALSTENMNVHLFLKIYEHCIKPILLYCSELCCLDSTI